jgi:hypothetical protein
MMPFLQLCSCSFEILTFAQNHYLNQKPLQIIANNPVFGEAVNMLTAQAERNVNDTLINLAGTKDFC